MTFAEILARQFSLSQYAEFFIRVLIACVCGAAIGFERSKRLKEAGIRTHIIVCCAAALTMLIDHIGAIFFPTVAMYRIIGRIAFPLYAFLLAEGVRRTKSPGGYGFRLTLGAVLAEWPFDVLFFGKFTCT